jgi:hypothetical protein
MILAAPVRKRQMTGAVQELAFLGQALKVEAFRAASVLPKVPELLRL